MSVVSSSPALPFTVREIRPGDDGAVEAVIRACLAEFGANREGFAWSDPDLGRFSQVDARPGWRYWVVLFPAGEIVGEAVALYRGEAVARVPLVLMQDLPQRGYLQSVREVLRLWPPGI